jgi:hypothetical protein
MVRIGGSTELGTHIKEEDYFTPQGEYRVDKEGSAKMLNCMMYKLCYYKFGQVYTDNGKAILYHPISKDALSLIKEFICVCRKATRLRSRT